MTDTKPKDPVGLHPKVQELPLVKGMYLGCYVLDPLDNFDLTDMVKAFSVFPTTDLQNIVRALTLRLTPEMFEKLPPEVREHFMVHSRGGTFYRYNPRARS